MDERIYKKYYIGKSKPGFWASVYVYKPHSHDIRITRGEIFAVISLSGPDTFAVSTAGNLILDNFHETYFENRTDSALIALEKAVKGASNYLQKLLENDSAADVGIDFDLSVITTLGDIVYFVSLGSNGIKMWRDNRMTDVDTILRDPTGEGVLKVGSMICKSNDVFLLATEHFKKEVTEDEMVELVSTFSDAPLKQRMFEDESKIAMLLVGYNINFEAIKTPKILDIKEEPIIEPEPEVESEEDIAPEKEDEEEKEEKKEKKELEIMDKDEEPDDDDFMMKEEDEHDEDEDEKPRKSIFKINSGNNDERTVIHYFKVAKEKIKRFGFLVWEDWLGMGKNSSNLKGANRNKRWGFLFIILIVVGSMIYFSVQDTLKTQREKTTQLEAQKYINEASSGLDNIENDAITIAKSNINTERKDLFIAQLAGIQTTLEKAKGVESLSTEYKVVEDRLKYMGDLINKTISLTSPEIIIDMGAKNPGATLSDIAIGNSLIYYSDDKYGKIYSSTYDGKTETEIGSGLSSPSTIAYDTNGKIIFLDKSTDRRMGIINLTDKTVERVAGSSETKLGGVTQIEYAMLNSKTKQVKVYSIDPVAKAVYQMESNGGGGYGLPGKRNINLPELSGVKDIAIMDLKIYLLLPYKQGIYRSLSDVEETPEILGLSSTDDLTNASAFYIDDLNLYIADSDSKSIYVITKENMQFKAKYTYTGSEGYFGNFKDLVADRTAGKIFVLDGSRIFVLSMEDLKNF